MSPFSLFIIQSTLPYFFWRTADNSWRLTLISTFTWTIPPSPHCIHQGTHSTGQNSASHCHFHEVHNFYASSFWWRGNLQQNFKTGAERKHIKVTDLWPKNAPNHIPLNYRHQGRAAKEALPFYCGNSAHTQKYIFTLPLKFDPQPTGNHLKHVISLCTQITKIQP